jgi:hypothetical protein
MALIKRFFSYIFRNIIFIQYSLLLQVMYFLIDEKSNSLIDAAIVLKPMPKIYIKTILLTIAVILLVELRLNLLIVTFHNIPVIVYDILIYTCVAAIVINEKFTKSERWRIINYIMLLCLTTTGLLIRIILWSIIGT